MFARSLKPSSYPESMTAIRSSSVIQNGRRTMYRLPQDPKDQEGVELLLGIATIVSKEIASSDKEIFDDGNCDNFQIMSGNSFAEPSVILEKSFSSRKSTDFPSSFLGDDDFAWQRIRSVSIDNEYNSPRKSPKVGQSRRSIKTKTTNSPAVVTPVGTRLRTVKKPSLKLLVHKRKKEQIKFSKTTHNNNMPSIMSQHKQKAIEQCSTKGKSIITIYRKKFSWKNYPELEAFLVANREEYLRHSALNYTIQQKKYNNRLTERLLDLAAEHLYVFNEDEFSFVTVRDRIRCFYKSYVQSSKKRGIVLGYAARKAGILTPADLQKSARKEGTIVTPLEL